MNPIDSNKINQTPRSESEPGLSQAPSKEEIEIKNIAENAGIILDEGKSSSVQGNVKDSQILPNDEASKGQISENTVNQMRSSAKSDKTRNTPTTRDGIKAAARNEIRADSKGVVQFSRKNRVNTEITNFKDSFAKDLTFKMSANFFPLYHKNVKNKSLQQKYENFNKDISVLKKEKENILAKIDEKISASKGEEKSSTKLFKEELSQLKSQKNKLDDRINYIEVRLQSTDEIKSALANVRAERKELSSAGKIDMRAINRNSQEESRLIGLQKVRDALPDKVRKGIDLDRERLIKFEKLNKKGEETRKRLVDIGGERISLETKDGAKLDGVFLNASEFRQKICDAGGEFITFPGQDALKGIAFDYDKWNKGDGSHIVKILKDLNAISYNNEQVAGWTPVKYSHSDGSEKIVLIPTESLPGKENDKGWVQKSGDETLNYEIKAKENSSVPETKKIEKKSEGGTVILSSGNVGVYEQHKSEAVAFLILGMNVVLFNYRGVGLSEGVPSDQNYHEDIETVYQFTKLHTGQQDSQLLFKGLCFGGGPSAYAAGKHPETNIFLDQTYSSFREIVEEQVTKVIHNKFKQDNAQEAVEMSKMQKNITPIVAKCASLVAPNFEVAKNLAKNRGKKALFYVHDDSLIPKTQVEKNINAAQKGRGNIKVIDSKGEHGDAWIDLGVKGHPVYQEIYEATKEGIQKIQEEYAPLIEIKQNQLDKIQEKKVELESKRRKTEDETDELLNLYMETPTIIDEVEKLESLKQEQIDKVFSDLGYDRKEIEKANASTYYHARNQMLEFLSEAHLSSPIF